jgi:hypothetical protein
MGYAAPPAGSDVNDLLTSAGVTLGTLETTDYALEARREFERRIGRTIYVDPLGAPTTRYFDPPAGRYVDFGADLAQLSAVAYQPQGASSESWTQNVDFWLTPYNAANDALPYAGMDLRRSWGIPLSDSLRRSVLVTGWWAFATSWPEDAWTAVVGRAAALAMIPYGLSISAGRSQYTNAGVTTTWGPARLRQELDAWNAGFEAAIRRYARVSL